jgi:hypothetical protein
MRKLAVFLCLSALSLVFASAARAVPPLIEPIPFPDFVDTSTCSFAIAVHFEGTVTAHIFFDKTGTVVKEIDIFGNFTVTFTDTRLGGKSLSTKGPAPGITTFNPDGSTDTATIVGLNAAIAIPGEGLVLLDAGRIVFEGGIGGPIRFENGPHQIFGTGDHSKFCAALADP